MHAKNERLLIKKLEFLQNIRIFAENNVGDESNM